MVGVACPIIKNLDVVETEKEDSVVVSKVGGNELENQAQGDSKYIKVYVRRTKQIEGAMPTTSPVPSPLSHLL